MNSRSRGLVQRFLSKGIDRFGTPLAALYAVAPGQFSERFDTGIPRVDQKSGATDGTGQRRESRGSTPPNENTTSIDEVLPPVKRDTATYGPWGADLVGSEDLNDPRPGLGDRIRAALDDGRPCIDITGAWAMEEGVDFSSASDTPHAGSPRRHVPVIVDADGAVIHFFGSGWAFTNDCTGNIGGQIAGGRFEIRGGVWVNAGDAAGFVRAIDASFNEFRPQTTRGFPIVFQPEIGTRWCESNVFGGQHHTPGTGIRAVGSRGDSFQDNYVVNVQIGKFREYAFDLSGNWNDCKFENPTCIAGAEGAAALRYNGNLDGTTIDNLEIEDADADLDAYYVVEIGPDATARGPDFDGGKHDYSRRSGLEFVDASDAEGAWHIWLTETTGGAKCEYRLCGDEDGFGTQRRRIFDGDGEREETADHPDHPSDGWS